MVAHIRQETPADYGEVERLVELAFENEPHSDHSEQRLVARLRKSKAFVPELSLVAEIGETLVGHVLLTRLPVNREEKSFESLALAPVAVLPEYQNRGIGSALIREGHHIAASLGFGSVLVLGHARYYPRFGYVPASRFNIRSPFDVPDDVYMALELRENALLDTGGRPVYPEEFFGG